MASDPNALPDPFGPDPFQPSTGSGTPQVSPADGSSSDAPATSAAGDTEQDPFASDPFQTPAGNDGAANPSADGNPPAISTPSDSDGTLAPQTGFWVDNRDPQFLIQWSLEEAQDPQLTGTSNSQAASPGYKARVRIFQTVFEATLAAARPVIPFSLRDAVDPYPYLQGSLVLVQQPSTPPALLVKNLKFSGFQQAQVVLYPSTPDAPGLGTSPQDGD